MPESLSRSVQTDLSDTAMDRRSFLRTGLGGAMFLGTVSVTAGLSGCAIAPAGRDYPMPGAMDQSYEFQFLTRDDIVLFQALLPAMVGPGLTEEPVEFRRVLFRSADAGDGGAGLVELGERQHAVRGCVP